MFITMLFCDSKKKKQSQTRKTQMINNWETHKWAMAHLLDEILYIATLINSVILYLWMLNWLRITGTKLPLSKTYINIFFMQCKELKKKGVSLKTDKIKMWCKNIFALVPPKQECHLYYSWARSPLQWRVHVTVHHGLLHNHRAHFLHWNFS